jgi:NADPH2:quinone reductase
VIDRVGPNVDPARIGERVWLWNAQWKRGLLPKIVAQDGLCVAYGSNAPQAAFEFGPMILSGAAVRFFIVYELSAAARERGVSDLIRWMTEGRLQHAIGAILPLERTAEAHELVERGKVIGNVIVRP